jgi:hypothetical protein
MHFIEQADMHRFDAPPESPLRSRGRQGKAFKEHGRRHTVDFLIRGLEAMSNRTKDELKDYFQDNCQIDIGTICAGSESPIVLARCLEEALDKVLGVRVRFPHSFSCEIDEDKRRFATEMVGNAQHTLGDACSLASSEVYDYNVQHHIPVPKCKIPIYGFPCQDSSRCNYHAVENRSSVFDGTLRTGSVFRGIVKFEQKLVKHIEFGISENVFALSDPPKHPETKETVGPSNLDFCVHYYKESGFWCLVLVLDPKTMRWPFSRSRLYLLHHPEDKLVMSIEDATSYALEVAQLLINEAFEWMPFEDLLLNENDAQVTAYLETCREILSKKHLVTSRKTKRRKREWVGKHEKTCGDKGEDWLLMTGPPLELYEAFPGLAALQDRELDLLVCRKIAFPSKVPSLTDVSQTDTRTSTKDPSIETGTAVTTKLKLYFSHLCRLNLGIEALHFQGIHYGARHYKLDFFSDAFLSNIGGNAFNMRAFYVAFQTGLCVAARSHVLRKGRYSLNHIYATDKLEEEEVEDLWGR